MSNKTFNDELEECKNDPYLTRLWYRYCQHLEIGGTHWRDSMAESKEEKTSDSMFEHLPKSKDFEIEQKLIAQNPNVDVNQLRLQMKYGSRSM